MSIFISSGAFSPVQTLAELLPRCLKSGVLQVELASGLKADAASLESLSASGNASFSFLLHNYFPAPETPFVLNLADRCEVNRRRSIEFCRDAMRLSALVDAPFYSVHAGYIASLVAEDLGRPERQGFQITEVEYDDALERFADSVSDLNLLASELGIRLLLENNVDAVGSADRSHLLLVSGADIHSFFTNHSLPSVGLLMDVAHLAVSATHRDFCAAEALVSVGQWIEALHLSDNDGSRDTNECCSSDSWFWEPLSRAVKPGIPTVLEVYGISDSQIRDQVALIESNLSQSAVCS